MDRRQYLAGLCAALAGCNARSFEGEQPATTTQPTYQTCPGPAGTCEYVQFGDSIDPPFVTGGLTYKEDREHFATLFTTRNDTERLDHLSEGPARRLIEETDFSSAVILIIQDGFESGSQPFSLERITAPEPKTLHATARKPHISGGDGDLVVPTLVARVPVDRSPSHLTVDIKSPYAPGEDFVVVDSFSMAETDPAYSSTTNSTE